MFSTYRILLAPPGGGAPLIIYAQGYGTHSAANRALDMHPAYTKATVTHVESARGDLRPLPSAVEVTR